MTHLFRLRHATVVCAIVQILMGAPASGAWGEQASMEAWQLAELQTLVDVVASAVRGELVPTKQPFAMTADFLKGMEGKTYVPFTLSIDSSQVMGSSLAMYFLVTPHADVLPVPSADGAIESLDQVFEDRHFIDVSGRAEDKAIEVSRAFTAVAGMYDVYVAVRDSLGPPSDDEVRESSTVLMLKEKVEIPDFWNDQLQTSSVIVAELVEPLDQPLSPDQQVASPYTLGTTRIVPKTNREFGSTDELALVVLVYNPRLSSDQMPDLTVDYSFQTQNESGEEFFNKTNPQQFNVQTLPLGFDLSVGHQIVAGQSIPLSAFPAGSYRLEINVTDNISGENVIRGVSFNVTE